MSEGRPVGPQESESSIRITALLRELEHERATRGATERAFIAALDAERQRFAQLLHDTVSQSLCAARLYARVARTAFEQTSLDASTTLGTLEEAVQAAANDTENFLQWLRPARLEGWGLAASLSNLAELASRTVPCDFECAKGAADLDADPRSQQELLRITQVALHALVRVRGADTPAPRLRLELALEEQTVLLEIRAPHDRRLSSDLATLLEARARALGGSFTDGRATTGESTWTCRLPR